MNQRIKIRYESERPLQKQGLNSSRIVDGVILAIEEFQKGDREDSIIKGCHSEGSDSEQSDGSDDLYMEGGGVSASSSSGRHTSNAAVGLNSQRKYVNHSPAISAIDHNTSDVIREEASFNDDNYNMPAIGSSKMPGSAQRIPIDRSAGPAFIDMAPNSHRGKHFSSTMNLGSAARVSTRQSVVGGVPGVDFEVERSNLNQQLLKFQKDLLKIMSKFAANHTVLKGVEELRDFMATEVTENDRMMTLLNSFTDFNVHTKITQQKEQIKLFAIAAEVFEDSLVPYIPKILTTLSKLIKEDATTKLHQTVADTMGLLSLNTVEKLEGLHHQTELFQNHYLKYVFHMLEKQQSKATQAGAILCLTQIVLNCPIEVLYECLDSVTDRIVAIVKQKSFGCKQQMLEGLISMIFYIKEDFTPYCNKFIPHLLEYMKISDPKQVNTKRVAIDLTYSIGAHCSDEIMEQIPVILKILDDCRTDKNQPVRAAAQETIKLLKELQKIEGGTTAADLGLEMGRLVTAPSAAASASTAREDDTSSALQRKKRSARMAVVQARGEANASARAAGRGQRASGQQQEEDGASEISEIGGGSGVLEVKDVVCDGQS